MRDKPLAVWLKGHESRLSYRPSRRIASRGREANLTTFPSFPTPLRRAKRRAFSIEVNLAPFLGARGRRGVNPARGRAACRVGGGLTTDWRTAVIPAQAGTQRLPAPGQKTPGSARSDGHTSELQ